MLVFLRLLTGFTFSVCLFFILKNPLFYTLFQELLDVNTYIEA